jgi:hypothetical protein
MIKTIIATVAGGVVVLGAAGAYKLFNTVIPRQDTLKVDISEMADMAKWEEYKKMIAPRAQWLDSQELEHITIKSHDKIILHGDYLKSKDSRGIVLCLHGYTGKGHDNCSIAKFFYELGYDCLLIDNRGHGKSEGDYIGFGILDRFDCLEWIKYINKRFNSKKNIILYGVSMGAATILMTAGFKEIPETVKAVISDCAFTSPYDVFSHILKRDYHLPKFPVMNINDMICRKKAGYGFRDYSTIEAVEKTKIPILFIHGKKDDFVPVYMSEQNYKSCNSPKDILLVENAAHGASYYENPEVYEDKIRNFLKKYAD